jgi:nucleotide-binding universal stress UspA family protein
MRKKARPSTMEGDQMIQTQGEQEQRIVVGVDGSVPSKAALGWAARQAVLTGAVVDAVIAWHFPAAYGFLVPVTPAADFEEIAAKVLAEAIAEVSATAGLVKIRSKVAEGNAAQILLTESARAGLLVVGSRGHGGFAEALLGSVGQHCVHHATCPVVVIRGAVTPAEGG